MDWRMQWVASTLHTTSEHGVSNITTADAAQLCCQQSTELKPTRRFKWTRSVSHERRNLVSARVPSHFNWPLQPPRSPDLSTADFSMWGQFKAPAVIRLQYKMNKSLDLRILFPAEPSATALRPSKCCNYP